jgi:hypothetical protein
MTQIADTATIASKWARKAALSAEDYRDGIQRTSANWADLTLAAAASYKAGLQAAMAANRFESGVTSAGTAKWKKNSLEKGPDRYAQGVGLAADSYIRGFSPFQAVIANTALPPRGARGDPKNWERSKVLGTALNRARTGK